MNPGAGKSFEQVGVNLRESREASEKERESKRYVIAHSLVGNRERPYEGEAGS